MSTYLFDPDGVGVKGASSRADGPASMESRHYTTLFFLLYDFTFVQHIAGDYQMPLGMKW